MSTGTIQSNESLSGSEGRRTDAAYASASVARGLGGIGSLLSTFGFDFLYTDDATVVTEKRDVSGFDLTGWRGSGPLRGMPVIWEYIDSEGSFDGSNSAIQKMT